MNIKCIECNGHYQLRNGKYGEFGGCSNFPKCNSTLKIEDLIFRFFIEESIKIYKWERECYKCNNLTDVYSYFLFYQLEKLDVSYSAVHGLGIGDIKWIDNYLKAKIPTIKDCYSRVTESKYTANTCVHCGALQGKNYVVIDPHEIMNELFHEKSMDKHLFGTVAVDESNTKFKSELRSYFLEK